MANARPKRIIGLALIAVGVVGPSLILPAISSPPGPENQQALAWVYYHRQTSSSTEQPDFSLPCSTSPYVKAVDCNITYCSPGGEALPMDIYIPNATGPYPVALELHGGGWHTGNQSYVPTSYLDGMAKAGFAVVTLYYRLSPEFKFPAQIQDVKCAVRFLRANSQSLDLNTSKIVVYGQSAGSHLGALLALPNEPPEWNQGQWSNYSSEVNAVVSLSAPTNLMEVSEFAPLGQDWIFTTFSSVELQQDSPVTYASADTVPFFVLTGWNDSLVPPTQTIQFYDALPVSLATLLMVNCAGHDLSPLPTTKCTPDPNVDDVAQDVVNFSITNA